MNPSRRTSMLVGGVLLVAASLGAGYWWGRHAHEVPVRTGATGERKVLYWYDPMVPGQHFDKPGKSPYMDMALVPRYADESTVAGAEKTGATISPRVQQNLGIRTVVVARGTLGLELHATGTVVWDARRTQVLSVPVDAVVQRLYVKTPYAAVHAGEPLASVLAPQWRSAISEAHALGQAQSAEAKALRHWGGARRYLAARTGPWQSHAAGAHRAGQSGRTACTRNAGRRHAVACRCERAAPRARRCRDP